MHLQKTKQMKTTEQFYEDLQSVVDEVPKSDIATTLGDLNGKLGKERVNSNVTGKCTLHDETNRNGEMLRELPFANNMTTMSSQFQHQQIHKATSISPDQTSTNKITPKQLGYLQIKPEQTKLIMYK